MSSSGGSRCAMARTAISKPANAAPSRIVTFPVCPSKAQPRHSRGKRSPCTNTCHGKDVQVDEDHVPLQQHRQVRLCFLLFYFLF